MRGDAGFPVRLRFAKYGKVRFISHRDVARAFERAFRIERLPLAFTQGNVEVFAVRLVPRGQGEPEAQLGPG